MRHGAGYGGVLGFSKTGASWEGVASWQGFAFGERLSFCFCFRMIPNNTVNRLIRRDLKKGYVRVQLDQQHQTIARIIGTFYILQFTEQTIESIVTLRLTHPQSSFPHPNWTRQCYLEHLNCFVPYRKLCYLSIFLHPQSSRVTEYYVIILQLYVVLHTKKWSTTIETSHQDPFSPWLA